MGAQHTGVLAAGAYTSLSRRYGPEWQTDLRLAQLYRFFFGVEAQSPGGSAPHGLAQQIGRPARPFVTEPHQVGAGELTASEETNLAQLFRDRTARYGDAIRWRQKQGEKWLSTSFRENQDLVTRVINGLDALGARPGDAIGILSNTRWEWTVADWAIMGLGGVTVTLYPSLVPDTVAFILRDSSARFLFVEDGVQYEKIRAIRQELPQLERLVLFDEYAPAQMDPTVMSFSALVGLSQRTTEEADAFAAQRARDILPDDPAALVYTSGTTGLPKGVILTHRTLLAQIVGARALLTTLHAGMIDLLWLPLSHVLGRLEHLVTVDFGGETVIEPSLANLAADLPIVKPNLLLGAPRLYEKAYVAVLEQVAEASPVERAIFHWAERTGRRAIRLRQARKHIPLHLQWQLAVADALAFRRVRAAFGGRLELAISGGAPLDPAIAEFFRAVGVPLLEGWGLTETGGAFTVNQVDDFRIGSVGKAFPGHEIRIASDGEILVRGPCVFPRYQNNPEATAEALDGEGWFHTGDIGTLDQEGFLTIVDRKKEMIVTAGGKKIAPQMVETLINSDPLVSWSCVYGDRKPYLVALLTLSWDAVKVWADAAGIKYETVRDVMASPRLRARLDEHMARVNAQIARFEQVKYYAILPDDFTVENGLLTPTQKTRRKLINERYKEQFEALYQHAPRTGDIPEDPHGEHVEAASAGGEA